MKTIRRCAFIALLALPVTALAQFNTLDSVAAHYLQPRVSIAPIIPPLLPSSLDDITAMIQKGDYSFQDLDGWYFPWADGPYTAGGEIAAYDGQTLIVYEDLSAAAVKIVTTFGKSLATFRSEPFPNLSALKGNAYDQAILAELNRSSISLWISFQNETESSPAASGAPPSSFGAE